MRSLMIRACLVGLFIQLTPALISAQNNPSATDTRAFPAPWRPSFGEKSSAPATPSTDNLDTNNLRTEDSTEAKIPPGSNPATLSAADASTGQAQQPQTAGVTDQSRQASATTDASNVQTGITRVGRTLDMLPNQAGQIWREYDISPYTSKITSTQNPQQAILDWILRETGTDMWFNQPLGILNADRNHIYVYHTPEIQNAVRKIVDRFVHTRGQVQAVEINLITVENPNWRSNVYPMLQPVDVQSPGVEAWMISKENAARLLGQLSRRSDFKQHSSGRLVAHDGQQLVLEKFQPRQFVRSLRWVPDQNPNYQPLLTTIDEGYKLEISSLSSLDDRLIEATIKCDVDQVEKLTTVKVDVPSITPGRIEQMDLQIPQLLSWRLHERFRWPNDQVLLLSCGVVAKPDPQAPLPGNFPRIFNSNRNRADALVFIEYRGPASSGQYPTPATPNGQLTPNAIEARVLDAADRVPVQPRR